MMNTGPWLQKVSERLTANGYRQLDPASYQPLGIKFAVQKSGFEISKFGMVDRVFTFVEIEKLDQSTLLSYSAAAFNFANSNKSTPLPNGFFMCVFCFPVVLTEGLDPQLNNMIEQNDPPKHWAANEMPVVYDMASGRLAYYQRTPVWGAAYFSGLRNEIVQNLG